METIITAIKKSDLSRHNVINIDESDSFRLYLLVNLDWAYFLETETTLCCYGELLEFLHNISFIRGRTWIYHFPIRKNCNLNAGRDGKCLQSNSHCEKK